MAVFDTLRAQLARMTQNCPDDDEEDEKAKVHALKSKGAECVFELHNNSQKIKIHEDPSHRLHYGATIWKCCRFLCNYFDERPSGFYRGKRVLEVGAGTGLAGLALASLGAEVVLTDTNMALPLIQHNLDLNERLAANVKILELEWYDAPKYISDFAPPVDIVVASDVVSRIYNNSAHPVLSNVLSLLCDSSTIVYVAYQERGVIGFQENFFKVMKTKGFGITEEFKTEDTDDILHIKVMKKL